MAMLVAISVGLPQSLTTSLRGDGHGPTWKSAINKRLVDGPVRVATTNLAGDGQADLEHHGGPDQAILGYSAEHYDHWRSTLPDVNWQHGGFGENFTISGQDEDSVCLGDVYAVGPVRIEVTKPRAPCYKISRRYGLKALTAMVEATGYHGWYYRILQEGDVEAGMLVELVARPHRELTIRRMNEVKAAPEKYPALAGEIAESTATTEGWRSYMRRALMQLSEE